jgi:hypothetical protein
VSLSSRQDVSPIVTTLLLIVALAVVGIVGFKMFGGPPRSKTNMPLVTQQNPGGPPPMATGGPGMPSGGPIGPPGGASGGYRR